MLWQGTTKVGFGVHDKYVIAWYCAEKAEIAVPARAKTNIGVNCYAGGYNTCYNALALKYANKVRNNHDVAPLKLDKGAAREIDYHLSAQRPGELLMPVPASRGWKYTGCQQSIFLEADLAKRAKVSSTTAAPEYWYGGVKSYDYATNAPKVVSTGYTEEAVACDQSVALAYRYHPVTKKYDTIKVAHTLTRAFLDCKKDCSTLPDCAAFETGPLNSCITYKFDSSQARSG